MGLLEFVSTAWKILEPAEPFLDNWHLHCFAEHAEAVSLGTLPEPNLLINTPPGTTKSMFWSVLWPAWDWTWAPWHRWLTLSYDDSLALRDAVRTRRLMQSDWYRRVAISEPWDFVGDQNVKGNYVNDKTGWRLAMSLKGGVTGSHAHVVVCDDPHSVRKAESDAERESTLTIWRETIPSRVLPSGTRVMVGQRTHEEDATADWLAREGADIHHIELKMEYEKPSGSTTEAIRSLTQTCTLNGKKHDPRTSEGELMVPQRFPERILERRKIELGPYAFASQFQQTPTPRKGMVLDPSWFPQTPRLEASTVDLVAAFDLNYSDVETSDWTVGLLGAVERTPVLPRIHLVSAFRDHLAERDHVAHIGEWLMLWKPKIVGIEKRAYEKQGAARDLCRQLLAYCEERGFTLDIEPIDVDTDKISRAMVIPGRAQHGLISIDKRMQAAPRGDLYWPILSRQMSQFPRSAHDDDVDALAHLVRLVIEKLERVRSMQQLVGKSADLSIVETVGTTSADWRQAAVMGLR